MRVTSKGQVTIPRDLRETFGISANSEVIFGIEGGRITITPKHDRGRLADREDSIAFSLRSIGLRAAAIRL